MYVQPKKKNMNPEMKAAKCIKSRYTTNHNKILNLN